MDLGRKTITLDGVAHDVDSYQALRWIIVLAEHLGEWISSTELKGHDPELDDPRPDRLKRLLPVEICQLISTNRRKGARLLLPPPCRRNKSALEPYLRQIGSAMIGFMRTIKLSSQARLDALTALRQLTLAGIIHASVPGGPGPAWGRLPRPFGLGAAASRTLPPFPPPPSLAAGSPRIDL